MPRAVIDKTVRYRALSSFFFSYASLIFVTGLIDKLIPQK